MFKVGDRVICINNFRFMDDPSSGATAGISFGVKYEINEIRDYGVGLVDNNLGFYLSSRFILDIGHARKEKLKRINETL
jgi:hypothetical protein